MVSEVKVAFGFGSLVADNYRLARENTLLRQAIEDKDNVLKACVEVLGLDSETGS